MARDFYRGFGLWVLARRWFSREDFLRILAAPKPTGIFSALARRDRPLADTSPARVVRNAPSPENPPVILALQPRQNPQEILRMQVLRTADKARYALLIPAPPRAALGGEVRGQASGFWIFGGQVFTPSKRFIRRFSTLWKNRAEKFHTMEKVSADFPHNGTTLGIFFHTVEKWGWPKKSGDQQPGRGVIHPVKKPWTEKSEARHGTR